MQYNMPAPPTLIGSPEQQLVQMHNYLFRMNEMLNQAIANNDVQIQTVVSQQALQSENANEISHDLVTQYNQAKALIIKTAEIVRSEMDVIKTELESKYLAISEEWGTYQEEISQEIEATATGIVQSFDYDAKLEAIGTEFESYVIESKGYIQSGIIGYDDKNLPIYGIAVGQDLASSTVIIDGVEQQEIDMTKNLATYTSDRITFWQNGIETAYITNNLMVINKVKMLEGLQFGDDWEISRTRGGFAIKWIGG